MKHLDRCPQQQPDQFHPLRGHIWETLAQMQTKPVCRQENSYIIHMILGLDLNFS